MFCPIDGTWNKENASFCNRCGHKIAYIPGIVSSQPPPFRPVQSKNRLLPSATPQIPSIQKNIGRRRIIKGGIVLAGSLAIGLGMPIISKLPGSGVAFADVTYDGMTAAAYADQWADSSTAGIDTSNGGSKEWKGEDCTNFVSNALYAGGLMMDDQWYSGIDQSGNWIYSNAWVNAPDLLNYLLSKGYARITLSNLYAIQRGHTNTNGLLPGDLVFFDWDGKGAIDHMAIQTTGTVDNNGNQYDQVDAHTDDRSGVFWTLEDYNPSADTTLITLVQIISNTATASYIPTY